MDDPSAAPVADNGMPDPQAEWQRYDRVIVRRSVGYLIDIAVIFLIEILLFMPAIFLGVISFGLLTFPLIFAFALIPLGYHTLLIGGIQSATFGMRIMGIEVRRMDGGRPDYIQAAILTVAFYISITVFWPLLILAFFNSHKRTLHDYLLGTVVINVPDPGLADSTV